MTIQQNDPHRQIEHLGFVVADLDASIRRWNEVAGYSFDGPFRFHTFHPDTESAAPKPHVYRTAFSVEGRPHIELIEAVAGSDTYGVEQIGPHHVCFRGVPDVERTRSDLAASGVGVEKELVAEDGRLRSFFTDKSELGGIRVEIVGMRPPGQLWTDDERRQIHRNPVTGIPEPGSVR